MIKLTLYDKRNNYRILENRYYKDSELDEALDLVKDFEKDEQISVGMDPNSRDYIGYFHKRRNIKKFRAALRAAMPAEEKERMKQLVKQHKKDTAECKKTVAAIRKAEPSSALAYEIPDDIWDKEMEEAPGTPHQFSEKFEREMEEILLRFEKNQRRRNILQYAAAAAVMVVALTVTLSWTSFRSALASEPGLTISAWLQDYFSFTQSSESNQEVLFGAERLTYIPEGFTLTETINSNTVIKYEYTSEDGKTFTLKVSNDNTSFQQHNEAIEKEIAINVSGYEYTYIYEKENHYHIFMWKDEEGLFFNLKGTLDKNVLIRIMNNIIYER